MAKSKAVYYELAFKADATAAAKSYDGLVSHLLQDDAYEKVYSSIANLVLHDRLIEFLQDKNNWADTNSVGPSARKVFKKPNGQQIDSSRRYLAVRDNADQIDLYVKITKGRNLGCFKMLTNEQEIAFLLIFGLEWMRDNGKAPTVIDFSKAVVDANLFVPRERQELISRTINTNILIAQTQSKAKTDVTKWGVTGAKSTATKAKGAAYTAPIASSAASSSSSSSSSSNTNQKSHPETIVNVQANGTRLTPVHQRLRQRKPMAPTATTTTKVSSGSGTAAKSSTGTKKADGTKRKNEYSDDDDLNGSSSKKSKQDPATGTAKKKGAKTSAKSEY